MKDHTIGGDETIAGGAGTLLAGRYRIVRPLGQGGMGSVWLAEDAQLDGKPFAVKMLPSILVSNKRAYRQLKDEALVAMQLVHPNIVQIRAFEENDGNPFLVMDYVDGQTLDDYLAEHAGATGVPPVDVLRILRPVAAALDYAHAKGVVHRDVKPGNVMIAKDGTPYILDFGIAREIQETMTRVTGKLSSGTLLYMSPEQLMGERPRPAQDVYSFAAMAYECLKGEPPFSHGQIEFQIMNKEPEPPPGGTQLVASVMAGLAKKPEDRPATCAGVLTGRRATPQGGRTQVDPQGGRTQVDPQGGRAQVDPQGGRTQVDPQGGRMQVDPQGGRARSPSAPQPERPRFRAPVAILSAVALLALGGALWHRTAQRQELARKSALAAQQAAARRQAEEEATRAEGAARRKARDEQLARQKRAEEERKAREAEARKLAEEARAKEAVAGIRIEARVQRGRAGRVSAEDGFTQKIEVNDDLYVKAEAFYDDQKWHEAAVAYSNYVDGCKALVLLDGARRQAVAQRSAVQASFKRAESAGAKTYAKDDWNAAVKTWNEAATEFRRMEFASAAETFAKALREFDGCAEEAQRRKRAEEEKLAEKKRMAEAREAERRRQEEAARQAEAVRRAEAKRAAAERERQRATADNGHEKVQLWAGGPYWATTNIGANRPEESGLYFWWGDTTGHPLSRSDGFAFNFSPDNSYTSGKSISELQSAGWLTHDGVLAPAHDAAHVQWGGAWRMPTKQELDDLCSKCDWSWTSMNGVSGYVVRGRGNYTSSYIFLPAARSGFRTSLKRSVSYGNYWSSVPTGGGGAGMLLFNSGGHYASSYPCCYGRSIRPVQGFTK